MAQQYADPATVETGRARPSDRHSAVIWRIITPKKDGSFGSAGYYIDRDSTITEDPNGSL